MNTFIEPKVVLLNTSIVTTYGNFDYKPTSLEIVKELVRSNTMPVVSAIGHASTAQIISTLLGVDISVNRIEYKQHPRDCVLVFKLNGRPEEGRILNVEEIEKIGYTWGRLFMNGARLKYERTLCCGNDVAFTEIDGGEKDGIYFSLNNGPYIGPFKTQEDGEKEAKEVIKGKADVHFLDDKLNQPQEEV